MRPRSCNCGECHKCKRADYMREWWHSKSAEHRRRLIDGRDPESVREHNRRKQQRRRIAGTPEQQRAIYARNKVKWALQSGELERPALCEDCGGTGRPYKDGRATIHAHHDSYDEPLEVRWLCRDCHEALHLEVAA